MTFNFLPRKTYFRFASALTEYFLNMTSTANLQYFIEFIHNRTFYSRKQKNRQGFPCEVCTHGLRPNRMFSCQPFVFVRYCANVFNFVYKDICAVQTVFCQTKFRSKTFMLWIYKLLYCSDVWYSVFASRKIKPNIHRNMFEMNTLKKNKNII